MLQGGRGAVTGDGCLGERLGREPALSGLSPRLFLSPGDRYWVFKDTHVEEGFPRPVSDFGLPPGGVDAAFSWAHSDKTYFFKDQLYWRYDELTRRMDPGHPARSPPWRGVPSTLDDAMRWSDGEPGGGAGGSRPGLREGAGGAADPPGPPHPLQCGRPGPVPSPRSSLTWRHRVPWKTRASHPSPCGRGPRSVLGPVRLRPGLRGLTLRPSSLLGPRSPAPAPSRRPACPASPHPEQRGAQRLLLPTGAAYFFRGREYWKVPDSELAVAPGYPQSTARDWLVCRDPQADPEGEGAEGGGGTHAPPGRHDHSHAEDGYQVCACSSLAARPPGPAGSLLATALLPPLGLLWRGARALAL